MAELEGFDPFQVWEHVGAQPDLEVVLGNEADTVALLEERAGGGPALELGVGRGRIARPLAAAGIHVHGIDFSPAMVASLREQPGGEHVSVTVADMTDFSLPEKYRLIYCVFNSLNNVLTQDDQVRCFEHVAAHLTDDGAFVLEAGATMRFLDRLRDGQYVEAEQHQVHRLGLDLVRIDAATQMLYESHVALSNDGIRLVPFVHRYTWPSEFDLMARIAGLRLTDRWGGWRHERFTADSPTVVSVYARA